MKINKILFAALGLFLIVSFILFGLVGFRSMFVMILVFFIPFYYILKRFEMEEDERIIFSFFIGLGLFPLVVFYVNRLVASFRVSTVIVFILLMVVGVYFSLRRAKKQKLAQQ